MKWITREPIIEDKWSSITPFEPFAISPRVCTDPECWVVVLWRMKKSYNIHNVHFRNKNLPWKYKEYFFAHVNYYIYIIVYERAWIESYLIYIPVPGCYPDWLNALLFWHTRPLLLTKRAILFSPDSKSRSVDHSPNQNHTQVMFYFLIFFFKIALHISVKVVK